MTDCGLNQTSSRVAHGRHGFTLVELLIVIGIIGVLVGILLPTVGKVRIAGQKVSTQSTINKISQGCEQYFLDHAAYPGPFAEVQLVHHTTTTPSDPTAPGAPDLVPTMYPLKYPDGTSFPDLAPTSSENLFLGLCGGLRVVVTTTTTFIYDADLAKRAAGPSSLNPGVAKKSQSYFDLSPGDISSDDNTRNPLNDPSMSTPGHWWPGAAAGGVAHVGTFAGDSPIFEFMDRFSKPRPILYLRAMRGVTRIAATGTDRTAFVFDIDPAEQANTYPYQYRADQIEYAYANLGKNRDGTVQAGKAWKVDEIDFPDALLDPAQPPSTGNTKFKAGDERYFVNEQISQGRPSAAHPDYNLVPQQKDKYILISAGPDGLYGTADDLRN